MVGVYKVFQEPKFQSLCHDLLFDCRFFVCFLFVIFQTNCEVNYSFFDVLQHGQYMYDSVAEVFSILATSRSYGNIHCSYQHYQLGKITLHFSVLMIEYCYVIWNMDDVIRATFSGFNDYCSRNCRWEKYYMCGKRSHLKKKLLILSWRIF